MVKQTARNNENLFDAYKEKMINNAANEGLSMYWANLTWAKYKNMKRGKRKRIAKRKRIGKKVRSCRRKGGKAGFRRVGYKRCLKKRTGAPSNHKPY